MIFCLELLHLLPWCFSTFFSLRWSLSASWGLLSLFPSSWPWWLWLSKIHVWTIVIRISSVDFLLVPTICVVRPLTCVSQASIQMAMFSILYPDLLLHPCLTTYHQNCYHGLCSHCNLFLLKRNFHHSFTMYSFSFIKNMYQVCDCRTSNILN